jgi:hypothetical protein
VGHGLEIVVGESDDHIAVLVAAGVTYDNAVDE